MSSTRKTGTNGRGNSKGWYNRMQNAIISNDLDSVKTTFDSLPSNITHADALIRPSVKQHQSGHNGMLCLAAVQSNHEIFKYLYGIAKKYLGDDAVKNPDDKCPHAQKVAYIELKNIYKLNGGGTRKAGGKRKSKNMLSSAKRWMKQMSRVFTKKTRKHRQ